MSYAIFVAYLYQELLFITNVFICFFFFFFGNLAIQFRGEEMQGLSLGLMLLKYHVSKKLPVKHPPSLLQLWQCGKTQGTRNPTCLTVSLVCFTVGWGGMEKGTFLWLPSLCVSGSCIHMASSNVL